MQAFYGPRDARCVVVFAPGDRGRALDPLARALGERLAQAGIGTLCFDAPTDNEAVLEQRLALELRNACSALRAEQRLILAGYSRGARVCRALASELHARALLSFAYPFHGPKQALDQGRVQELREFALATLICQGARDPHGNLDQVRGYALPANIRMHWMPKLKHALGKRELETAELPLALDAALAFVREFA